MPFPVLLGVLVAGSMKLVVEPRQISRFFALKDRHSVRQGIWVAVIGIAVIQFCILPIGIYAHLFFTDVVDTDLIVPMLVASSMFPDVLAAFLVLAIGQCFVSGRLYPGTGCGLSWFSKTIRAEESQSHTCACGSDFPRHRGDCAAATGWRR